MLDDEFDFARALDDQLCVPCILCNCQGCDNCVPYGKWTYADGMAGDERNGHKCDGEGS